MEGVKTKGGQDMRGKVPRMLDRIRRGVLRRAGEEGWAERAGARQFRYADGSPNPFIARYLEENGSEALAGLAARASAGDPALRRKWLLAVREYGRDARGRFTGG